MLLPLYQRRGAVTLPLYDTRIGPSVTFKSATATRIDEPRQEWSEQTPEVPD